MGIKMKLKDLLNENVLGDLPSSKLMKMKWNPVTDKKQVKEDKLNEFDRRMISLVNNSDKKKLADALYGYVFELADDGYDEKDIKKYILKLTEDYIRSYYRQATR